MRLQLPEAIRARLLTPALAIDLQIVRRNLARLVEAAGGVSRLRCHTKTAKLPIVYREMVRAGLRNLKCATTREAACLLACFDEVGGHDSALGGDSALGRAGGGDLLVAYPHRDANMRRLEALAAAHPRSRVSVLCESLPLATEALGVFVDVNAGMDRTGIPLAQTARILEVVRAAGSRFRGLHFYEGHVHSGTFEERCAQAHPLYDALLDLIELVRDDGVHSIEVVTSGTPSFMPARAHDGLARLAAAGAIEHRFSPGTLVYFDARSAECDELAAVYEPAAFVLARVVSHPGDRLITVDAGSKSLAAEAGSPVAVVDGLCELRARTPSEEHLPIEVPGEEPLPARGELLALIPRHVCPTVNLAEEALVVDGAGARVAPVAARAHELLSDA